MINKRLLSLLLSLLVGVSFTSCSNDSEEELSATVGLIGNWTLQSADTRINDQSMEEFISELASLMNVPAETISEDFDMGGDFASGTTIEFREDGSYVLTESDDTSETGLWTATDKTVTISDADGDDPVTLEVRSLTSNKAILYMLEEESDGEMAMKMEFTLNFTK